jgi:hypothetical protein
VAAKNRGIVNCRYLAATLSLPGGRAESTSTSKLAAESAIDAPGDRFR